MRTFRFIAAALTLVCMVSIMGGCSSQQSAKTIRIGHLAALTGDPAVFGQAESTGLQIAVEEINKKGGILGRKVEVVTLDTRGDPAEASNAAKRMVQENVVAIVGVAQSGVANAVHPVITEAKIPTISTGATNPYVTVGKDGALKKYMFRVCFIDTAVGSVMAQFASENLGAKAAAVLYDVGSDYSQWLAKYFAESFPKFGGKIVGMEAYRTGELDYRAQLTKIKAGEPDFLFLPLNTKDSALAAKQARELGITCPVGGGDDWASPAVVELGGQAVEGGCLVSLAALDDPSVKDWLKANEPRFKGPVTQNALMVTDAMLLLADAITRAGGTDPDKIVAALEATKDLPVLTTDRFSVDPKTHNPLDRKIPVSQIKNGEFVFVAKYSGK